MLGGVSTTETVPLSRANRKIHPGKAHKPPSDLLITLMQSVLRVSYKANQGITKKGVKIFLAFRFHVTYLIAAACAETRVALKREPLIDPQQAQQTRVLAQRNLNANGPRLSRAARRRRRFQPQPADPRPPPRLLTTATRPRPPRKATPCRGRRTRAREDNRGRKSASSCRHYYPTTTTTTTTLRFGEEQDGKARNCAWSRCILGNLVFFVVLHHHHDASHSYSKFLIQIPNRININIFFRQSQRF